jgi:hypothetical protein
LAINDKKIFECYGEFTETMRTIYDNLRVIYTKLSNRILSEDDLNEIDFPRVPKELEIKGLEKYLDLDIKERLIKKGSNKQINKIQKILTVKEENI